MVNFLRIDMIQKQVFLLMLLSIMMTRATALAGEDPVDSSAFHVDEIRIEGLDLTRKYVVQREILIRPGETANDETMERDRKRVQNLNLFNRVQVYRSREKDKNVMVVRVTERWYVLPFLILAPNEGTLSRLSYGGGVTHHNFRGRNETLGGAAWFGYNPGGRIFFSNPWIAGDLKLSVYANASYSKTRNLSVSFRNENNNFDRTFKSINFGLGKRYALHFFTNINLGYTEVSVPSALIDSASDPESFTQSENGRDRMLSVGLSIWYDNRDLWEYPERGNYFALGYSKTGYGKTVVDFHRFIIDLRRYQPVGIPHVTLALRSTTILTARKVPAHAQVYIGYENKVRGSELLEGGNNTSLLGAELRYPIWPIRYYTWKSAPKASKTAFYDLKFGISGTVFVDAGQVWDGRDASSNKFAVDRYSVGFGLGLNFHVPTTVNIWRTEVGFDKNLNARFYRFNVFASF